MSNEIDKMVEKYRVAVKESLKPHTKRAYCGDMLNRMKAAVNVLLREVEPEIKVEDDPDDPSRFVLSDTIPEWWNIDPELMAELAAIQVGELVAYVFVGGPRDDEVSRPTPFGLSLVVDDGHEYRADGSEDEQGRPRLVYQGHFPGKYGAPETTHDPR